MSQHSEASRRKLYGERICAYAKCPRKGQPFVPRMRSQANRPTACCSRQCAVKRRVALGSLQTPALLAALAKGRKKWQQSARQRAILALAFDFGGPVTDRDLAMYRLGWKRSYEMHRSTWLSKWQRLERRERFEIEKMPDGDEAVQ